MVIRTGSKERCNVGILTENAYYLFSLVLAIQADYLFIILQ